MKRFVLTLVAFAVVWAPQFASAQTTPINLAEKGFSFKGAAYHDIKQGRAGTCWILSSMAALESNGIDLTNRIHYLYNPWGMQVDVSWNDIKSEGGSFVIR